MNHFVSHSKCRLCDSGNIEQVIDLGYSPLANAYLTEAQLKDVRSGALEEIFTPLRCFLCMDCGSADPEGSYRIHEAGYHHCMAHLTERATAKYVLNTIAAHDWSKPTQLDIPKI